VGAERRRESLAERRARRGEIDDPAVVLEAAGRFLEVRPRSVQEVRRRLTQAGYRADLIDAAIGRFTELGMLDDAAFATQWVESRDRAHPRGEHALVIELRQKGIDAATIAATLKARRETAVQWEDRTSEAADNREEPTLQPLPGADERAARKLLMRQVRSLERISDVRLRRQRAYAVLARNGFDPDTCREVSRSVVEELGAGSAASNAADEGLARD
jgi:regulatory protein